MLAPTPPTPGPYPPAFPPHPPAGPGDWLWSALANVWSFLGWLLSHLWSFVETEAGAIAAVAAVVAAMVAIRTLVMTSNDSRERSRPVVYASFEPAKHNDRAFDFVVRNYGPSAAKNVTLTFDPPFDATQRQDRLAEIVAQRWEKSMPLLPPGAEVRNLWWSSRPGPGGGDEGARNGLATPDEVAVTVSYFGVRKKPYTEVVLLDGRWRKLDSSSVSSDSGRGRLKQIAEAAREFVSESHAMTDLIRNAIDTITGAKPLDPNPEPGSYERAVAAFGAMGVELPERDSPDGAVPETPAIREAIKDAKAGAMTAEPAPKKRAPAKKPDMSGKG